LKPGPRSPRRRRGFTLTELIAVVVILGVIAAVAIPYFVTLRGESYRSAVASVIGSFQSGIHLSTQLCRTRGWAGRDNLQGLGSGNVDFNANCLPSDTSGSNAVGANSRRCMHIFQGILNTGYTVDTSLGADPDFRASVSGQDCRFTFRRDTVVRRFDYNPATGTLLNVVNP
jgi:MSHA pilin protein MshB